MDSARHQPTVDLDQNRPDLHGDGERNWMITSEVLEFLGAHVDHGSTTAETGAGYSTILLAQLGARHTSITPDDGEAEAIRDYCRDHEISTETIRFVHGFSQDVLPSLTLGDLDLVLIDGGHGFPIPAVDYCYLAPHLKVGGHLLIDDTDIWTGAMIVSVLRQEPEWTYLGKLARRTAVFRKDAPSVMREWCDQPAVVARSRVGRTTRQAANGLERLAKGDLRGIGDRLRRGRRLRRERR